MDEGKEILYKFIEFKSHNISSVDQDEIIIDGINLVDIADMLEKSIDNLCDVPDSIIDKVIDDAKIDDINFKKNIVQLRDLLVGKRNYNLFVKISKEYERNMLILLASHLQIESAEAIVCQIFWICLLSIRLHPVDVVYNELKF